MTEQSGEFDLPLTLFGGRFGKTGTEPDEITNDDAFHIWLRWTIT